MTRLQRIEKTIHEDTRNGYVVKDFAPDASFPKSTKYFVYQKSSYGFQNVGMYGKLVFTAKKLKEIEKHDFSQYED